MGLQVYDENSPKLWILPWNGPGGDGENTVVFGEGNGSRVDSMSVYNPDSIDHTFTMQVAAEGLSAVFGNVSVPAGAGSLTIPFADVLAAFAPSQLNALIFPKGASIQMFLNEAIVDSVVVVMLMYGGIF